MKLHRLLFTHLSSLFILIICTNATETAVPENGMRKSVARLFQPDLILSEAFELGSKNAYASENVTFATGLWSLDDAMTGSLAADRKSGAQSVRIRRLGKLRMKFDTERAVSKVTLKYAVFGADGPSNFQLWVSDDKGKRYRQAGATVTAADTTLRTATFVVNADDAVRFEIRKTTGGNNRINIDDFVVYSYREVATADSSISDTFGDNTNMLLGNPSGAISSVLNPNNYLIDQTYFVESYDRDKTGPNWVSWYVGSTSLGSAKRVNSFRVDERLPLSWYRVSSSSYEGSGFNRGHNCPSADRTSTTEANRATFLMTNMIPQAPNNNQQTWGNLEDYTRSLVNAGNEVYVIMGSYGKGGVGSKGFAAAIDDGKICVPRRIWKVIVVLPDGGEDLRRINSSTRVIAVNTPNDNDVKPDWRLYRVNVRSIEKATGYNLLSALPKRLQDVLETRVDSL
ncbi:endonuclease G [Arcticibacter tournemirensis]|uniref:DNA/RNA non-specific endonuclease n=1 Tax=Arcticibacter tournemirensis TaxID=699437 RepID=A0A5M9H8R3_9SPHI|nr:DNA/RNA non-specific endonuclease [Arcticibacter tournemirensis]KAA8481568.1 DNA/RNA non-specific endonuclease [Arcticibacter tournemirensis]TQM49044.1 endonuclease G [Arcticibacter tournemirensis]